MPAVDERLKSENPRASLRVNAHYRVGRVRVWDTLSSYEWYLAPMYPHQNLDWQIQTLESRVRATPDDVDTRLQLGHHELSKAWFHGGGDANFNNARHHAQAILKTDRDHLDAHILVGSAHVGLGPHETALQHLNRGKKVHVEHLNRGKTVHACHYVLVKVSEDAAVSLCLGERRL